MNRITLEAFHDDPHLRRRLYEAAHRERALAVRAGLAWLHGSLARLATRVSARLRPDHSGRWIARLG